MLAAQTVQLYKYNGGGVGVGNITLTQTNAQGCTASKTICVEILPQPRSVFTVAGYADSARNITVCLNELLHFKDFSEPGNGSPLENWYWNFGDGTTYTSSTTLPVSHAYNSPGNYVVTLTVKNQCNCTATTTLNVTVLPEPTTPIVCASSVCEGATATYTANIDNCEGIWIIEGGSIIQDLGNIATVTWNKVDENGFGYLHFNYSGCDAPCPGKSTIKVPVIANQGVIKGALRTCINTQQVYRLPAWPGTVFNWQINGSISGTLPVLHTDQPNEIVINAQIQETITIVCEYFNALLNCNGTATLVVVAETPVVVNGATTACEGETINYLLTGTTTNNWQWIIKQPNGSNLTVNGATNNPLSLSNVQSGMYSINVKSNDFCVPPTITLQVNSLPLAPNYIVGKEAVCPDVAYTYTAGNATANHEFVWEIVQGTATIVGSNTGNNAVIKYTGNGPWQIGVRRINMLTPNCPSAIIIKNITKAIVPANIIVGSANVCPNSYEDYYSSYTEGETYEWSIIPAVAGSVVLGNGTPNIRILWNNNSNNTPKTIRLEVRKCGFIYVRTFNVNLTITPTISLNFPTSVCRGETVIFNANLTPALSGPVFEWNFGDGTIVQAGATITHKYQALSSSNLTYAVSAKLLYFSGCANITQVVGAGSIEVKPAPVINISPAGRLTYCNKLNPEPITATLLSGYGSTTQITWYTPTGTINCPSPFTGCNPLIANTAGNYFAVATNNLNCSSKSENLEIEEDCPDSCTIANYYDPIATISYNCGTANINVNYAGTPLSHDWSFDNPTIISNVYTTINSWLGTFSEVGIHTVKYTLVYLDVNKKPCTRKLGFNVKIPLIPKFLYKLTCSSGNDYTLQMYNSSAYLPGTVFNSYTFYVYNATGTTLLQSQQVYHPINSHNFTLSAGASYQIKMAVNYTYNGITQTCFTELQNITAPKKPLANFSFNSNNRCEGVPVQFTNLSTPNTPGTFTPQWNFGDGATVLVNNPSRVFEYTAGNPTKNVTLTIQNPYGCSSNSTQSITISPNELKSQVNLLPIDGAIICSGSSQLLQHVNLSSITPVSYRWMQDPSTALSTTNHPINYFSVNQTGYYWVRVEDANLCYVNTDAVSVGVIPLLQPVITGNAQQCAHMPFTLAAYVGSTQTITYQWYKNGQPINQPNSYLLQEPNGLPPGTYNYTVEVQITQGTFTCSQTANTFTVTVMPPPAPPAINAFLESCQPYILKLQAYNPLSGNYAWSNGNQGQSITVNQGGFYKVWFTGANGCTSSTTVAVDKDPQGYVWIVPEGCYNLCLPDDINNYPIVLPGTQQSFTHWQWQINTYPHVSGTQSAVTPLPVIMPAQYNLQLTNSFGCSATSGTLHFNIPQQCMPQELSCSAIEPALQVTNVTPNEQGGCTLTLNLTLFNGNYLPIPYSVQSLQGGTIISSGGIAAPGSSSQQLLQFIPTVNGNHVIKLIFWLAAEGDMCEYDFDIWVDCASGKYQTAIKSKNNSTLIPQQPQKKYLLQVYPNPVQNNTLVTYECNNNNSHLLLFDALGKMQQNITLVNKKGTLVLPTWHLTKGTYWLVLIENNSVKAKQTIIKQ